MPNPESGAGGHCSMPRPESGGGVVTDMMPIEPIGNGAEGICAKPIGIGTTGICANPTGI